MHDKLFSLSGLLFGTDVIRAVAGVYASRDIGWLVIIAGASPTAIESFIHGGQLASDAVKALCWELLELDYDARANALFAAKGRGPSVGRHPSSHSRPRRRPSR